MNSTVEGLLCRHEIDWEKCPFSWRRTFNCSEFFKGICYQFYTDVTIASVWPADELPFDSVMNVTTCDDVDDNIGVAGADLTSGTFVAMSRFLGWDAVSSTVRWQLLLLLSSAVILVMTGYPDTCSLRGSSCLVGLPSSQLLTIRLTIKFKIILCFKYFF